MNPLQLALVLHLVVSLVTFGAYGLDKRAARLGRRRIPEARLHTLELLGGWPGALAGQSIFRHKRQKGRYMLVFWCIVGLHLASWCAFAAWRAGFLR